MTSEDTGILVFGLAATLLVLLLIIACCHRYYKIKQMRATAAMLPNWDGRQTLDGTPAGPSYMPAPATHNFQPLPNVLYTGTPYHRSLPAHVQVYQQQHMQPASRLPNAADRQDHLCATPGAYQLNQQAAMATPNVVGCFYGAAYVPPNPYGPTSYGLVEQITPQQDATFQNTTTQPTNILNPPTYDQALNVKSGMTAVSE